MFWASVWKGFLVLLEWRIWIFIGVYSLVTYLHHAYFIKRVVYYNVTNGGEGMVRAVNSYTVLKTAIDTFIVVLTTFFIFPILAGAHQLMPYRDIKATFKIILIITLVIAAVRVVLNAISGPSKDVFRTGGNATSFFVCLVLIYFMSHEIFGQLPEDIKLPENSYPGFFACLGFVLLTFPIVIIFSMGLGIVLMPFSEKSREFITQAITIAIIFIMGIIYMRMYCAYIMHNIEFDYNPGGTI